MVAQRDAHAGDPTAGACPAGFRVVGQFTGSLEQDAAACFSTIYMPNTSADQ
jgi:hypothetical protein